MKKEHLLRWRGMTDTEYIAKLPQTEKMSGPTVLWAKLPACHLSYRTTVNVKPFYLILNKKKLCNTYSHFKVFD